MKLYVSVDIEGVAGVVHWDQIMPGSPDYELGRRLLMREVNSICRGAVIAGAETIVVNDAHGPMRNIVPDGIDEHARLITGHFKPMYMMEGLDESFDAAVFLGYHGSAGTSSVLSHSYSPRVIWEARIDGRVTGETGINALVAHHFGVPVIMITGDESTIEDAKHWIPEAKGFAVKRSLSRFSAESMSPERAYALLFDAVQSALENVSPPPRPANETISLELTLQSADMAMVAEWGGARRTSERVVCIEGDGLTAYKTFHAVLLLARALADA